MEPKQRLAIPRQQAEELSVDERINNFNEVVSGLDEASARLEAERCLLCKKPPCRKGCPVGNDIPGFIEHIRRGSFEEGYWLDRQTNSLPAICSRVCPHEFQCEGHCVRGKKSEPVAIGMLERFLVDWMVANGRNMVESCALPNGHDIAIVGSGPAGMSVAYYLAKKGYRCTIFESEDKAGGMLALGIPAYRLPRSIIAAEFDALASCGVKLVSGVRIGRDKSLAELKSEGYSAVFLAPGAHSSRKLGIEGETLAGVIHGTDYLRRVNLGETLSLGDRVLVVGGGNVAIDCARTVLRLGAKDITLLYRRSRDEMPASKAEIHHLEEEGVKIELLTAPVKIHGSEGRVESVECIRMQLGECDASGRCRPVPIEGSNFMIAADALIPAVSQDVDSSAAAGLDIELSSWGTFVVNEETLQTSVPWIFSAGDAVLGPQTVAKAVAQAKKAAQAIDEMLMGENR